MRILSYFCVFFTLLAGCKQTQNIEKQTVKSLTPAEQIAKTHGFDVWKDVKQVSFTFNGKRHWVWKPQTNDITYSEDSTTVSYNRNNMDSTLMKIDRGFINDKFWLLIPFQMVWDEGLSISEPTRETAPISEEQMNKITLTYSNEGGYTPGDAYDIFYDENFIIREWIFRKGNQTEPSLTTTFEKYEDFHGIKIALEHKNKKGSWNLTFSDVAISK